MAFDRQLPETLLQTKLSMPRLGEVISRPRLLGLFESGAQRPLTLVSAPPGYGKTTLVVQSLSGSAPACVWLSLDPRDNDSVRFFSYLIAALRKRDPDIGTAAQRMLALPRLPSGEVLVTSLINDLDATLTGAAPGAESAAAPLVLVLDDYHTISERFIHEAVEFLVEHSPAALRTVVITRQDPPFALPRLRVRQQLTEIRAGDLRFTPEEAAEWLNRHMALNLDEDEVQALQNKTEGWIAGLELAGLSLRGRDPALTPQFIQDLNGTERYIIDYLAEEVLRQQPEETVAFLTRTSILDRFTPSLCDAVMGRSDSRSVLARLEQANLFLIPLDGHREWYRYHPLFADFLRSGMTGQERLDLHRKAARWYEANGFTMEAIEHALAGQDIQAASAWIEQMAGALFARGELGTLRRWFERLPDSAFERNGDLSVLKAWTLYFAGQPNEARACAAEAAPSSDENDAPGRGRFLALQAALATQREEWSRAAILARQALDRIGDRDPFFRIMTLQSLAEAERHSGHAEQATSTLRAAFDLAASLGHPFAELIAVTALIPNLNRQGRRREALGYCRRLLGEDSDGHVKNRPSAGLLNVQLAMLEYAAGELDPAYEHVTKGLALYKELHLDRLAIGDGEWTLVQILCARGELEPARVLARETQRRAAEFNNARIALLMEAVVADVERRLGNLPAAARWAEEAGVSLPIPLNPSYEFAYFVLVRVLLAQERFEEALLLLGNLNESAQRDGRHGRLITVYILQALAHHLLGNHDVALDRLAAAVRIAAPEQYRRAFLDEGPAVGQLLPHVRRCAPKFVDGLLCAFEQEQRATESKEQEQVAAEDQSSPSPRPRSVPFTVSGFPVEPLSDRECEVLRLIADGKSNAEIAKALVVAVGTAKWHVHHVLAKLGVSSRTQAIARARELNLL